VTWNPDEHPRAAGGTFTEKPQSAPEADLALPVQFVRTASGVHRVRATTPQDAARIHTENTGEEATAWEPRELIVRVDCGRIRVEYRFDGEGEEGDYDPFDETDTPFARVNITALPGADSDEEFESHSWCTRVPAYGDSDRFAIRGSALAMELARQVEAGEDADEVARRAARRLADMPDEVIDPASARV